MANMAAKATAAYFDALGIKYDIFGDDNEVITARYGAENIDSIRVFMIFDSDGEGVKLTARGFAKFPESKMAAMYKVCNSLNADYRWIKFYVREADCTIAAEDDAVIQLDTCGQEVYQCMGQLISIVDNAYPELMRAIYS